MTPVQKIDLQRSEVRQKLNTLLGKDDLTDPERAELETLTTRAQQLEIEYRAAVVASGDAEPTEETTEETPEDLELRALVDQANLGGIVSAVLENKHTDGAERELQQHLGMAANQVPLDLITRQDDEDLEIRTTGVTPAPAAGSIGAVQHAIIPAVFPMSVASFLRIPQPRVGVGEQVYTVLSTSAVARTPAKGAEAAFSTAAFTAAVLSPSRIQASVFFAIEDRARLRGLEPALREDLSAALSDKLDEIVVDDLLTGNTLGANAASAADTFESYRTRFAYDHVDGKRAGMVSDLRIVVGTKTYADMASSYRGNSSDLAALASLRAETNGVLVTAHAPDVASEKQNGVVRIGSRQDAVTPIWEGISLLVDPYTQRDEGEIVLSVVMLYGHKVLRTDGFAKVEAQHS